MAQTITLEGLRSQMMTSVFGRRLGFDSAGYLVGVPSLRVPTATAITSTASATTMPAYGVSQFNMSGASGSTGNLFLAPPVPGITKSLVNLSTQYVVVMVDGASTGITVLSTFGTTAARIFIPSRQSCQLLGLTTAVWQLLGVGRGSSVGTTEYVKVDGDTCP